MREINRRAKNMLSVVDAIAHQTTIKNPEDFVERFSERIQPLSANQDLLVRNEWNGVEIRLGSRPARPLRRPHWFSYRRACAPLMEWERPNTGGWRASQESGRDGSGDLPDAKTRGHQRELLECRRIRGRRADDQIMLARATPSPIVPAPTKIFAKP